MRTIFTFLMLLSCVFTFSQTTISGTVVDDNGIPLPGANVVVQNTSTGTVTDFDGNFSIDNVASDAILTFSYVGFATQNVPVNGQSTINVVLAEDAAQLDEVVVAARKNKGEPLNDMATVSARSVTVEETQRFAGSFNDPSRLVSSYAGVMGDPDGNNDIIIRGNSPRGIHWRIEGGGRAHHNQLVATAIGTAGLHSGLLDQ